MNIDNPVHDVINVNININLSRKSFTTNILMHLIN